MGIPYGVCLLDVSYARGKHTHTHTHTRTHKHAPTWRRQARSVRVAPARPLPSCAYECQCLCGGPTHPHRTLRHITVKLRHNSWQTSWLINSTSISNGLAPRSLLIKQKPTMEQTTREAPHFGKESCWIHDAYVLKYPWRGPVAGQILHGGCEGEGGEGKGGGRERKVQGCVCRTPPCHEALFKPLKACSVLTAILAKPRPGRRR